MPSGRRGRVEVVVRLREQRAYLFRNRREFAEAGISTGKQGHETPLGRFKVIQKDIDHHSNLYGKYLDADDRVIKSNVDVRKDPLPPFAHFQGAPMPYFVEFSPGYGLHAGYLPGYAASHGCVRLSRWDARRFYNATRIGTPVIIRN